MYLWLEKNAILVAPKWVLKDKIRMGKIPTDTIAFPPKAIAILTILLWLIIISWALFAPNPHIGDIALQKYDKMGHLILFLAGYFLASHIINTKLAAGGLIMLALSTEILQAFTSTRHFSTLDLLMNILGVLAGVGLKWLSERRFQTEKTSLTNRKKGLWIWGMKKYCVLGLLSSLVLAGQGIASSPNPTNTFVGPIIETRGLTAGNAKYIISTNGANFFGYSTKIGTNTHTLRVFFNGTKGPVSNISRIEQTVNPGAINRVLFPVGTNNYVLTWNSTNNAVINYTGRALSYGFRGTPGLTQVFDRPIMTQEPRYQVSVGYTRGADEFTGTEDATLATYTIETVSDTPFPQPKYRVIIDNAQGETVYQGPIQTITNTNPNRVWRHPFKVYRSTFGGLPNGSYTVNVEVRNTTNNSFLGGASALGEIKAETSQLGSGLTGQALGTAVIEVNPNVIPSQIAAARGRLETLASQEWNRLGTRLNTVVREAASATQYPHNFAITNSIAPYRSTFSFTGNSSSPSAVAIVNNSWTNMSRFLSTNSYSISYRTATRNVTNGDGVISYRYQYGLSSRDNITIPVN